MPKPKLVIGVGDSITNGCCCNKEGASKNLYGFMHMLRERLQGHGYKFKIFAKNGATALKVGHDKDMPGQKGLKDRSFWNLKYLEQSLKSKPDIVLFMFGTNDVSWWGRGAELHFLSDWKSLVNNFMRLKNCRVVTMIPSPSLNWSCSSSDARRSDYDASRFCSLATDNDSRTRCLRTCLLPSLIRQGASELGLPPPLDLNGLLGGPDQTSSIYTWTLAENALASPAHPTCAGHERIAKYIAQQLFPESEQYLKETIFPNPFAGTTLSQVSKEEREVAAGDEIQLEALSSTEKPFEQVTSDIEGRDNLISLPQKVQQMSGGDIEDGHALPQQLNDLTNQLHGNKGFVETPPPSPETYGSSESTNGDEGAEKFLTLQRAHRREAVVNSSTGPVVIGNGGPKTSWLHFSPDFTDSNVLISGIGILVFGIVLSCRRRRLHNSRVKDRPS